MRKNKSKNKLFALLLTAFLMSGSAGALSACSKTTKSDPDQTEISSDQTTDVARIKNGSFEFDTQKDTSPIVTSPKNWSRSSVFTSKAASGVIDTESSAWDKLTKTGNVSPANETEAEEKWESMNAYDRLQFIKTWKDENKNKTLDDLEFYKDRYNISADDIPDNDVNPGTHYAADSNEAKKNTKVLMIHNQYNTSAGTGQSYTSSSSLTVPAGTSAKLSVWVKTAKLTYGEEKYEADKNRGAYVGISRTVAGKSKEQVQVKNINTEKILADDTIPAENKSNGWVKYEFYLEGSNYASSTFTIVLGLGQGTSSSVLGLINGYAFFDDLECTLIENSEYATLAAGAQATADDDTTQFLADKESLAKVKYAVKSNTPFHSVTFAEAGITGATAIEADNNHFDVSEDKTGVFTKNSVNTETETNEYFKTVWDNDFASAYPFADTNEVLMLFSAGKTAYEATTKKITLSANSSTLFSVWVKTSKTPGGATGAGISYTETDAAGNVKSEEEKKTSLLTSIDSTTGGKTEVDGTAGGVKEDIFCGWQQCTLLIENETDENKYFTLTFTYGATSKDAEKTAYNIGYAAFTNLQAIGSKLTATDSDPFTQQEFFTTGTYAAKKTFSNEQEDAGFAAFDSRAYDSDNTVKGIEHGFADLASYKGVWGGSRNVCAVAQEGVSDEIDNNPYAGLVNKNYAANYVTSNRYASVTGLNTLFGVADTAFDRAAEPLLIYNKEENKSYGYLANSPVTVSPDSYKTISVRVKTSSGAKASIYLIDTNSDNSSTSLKLSTPKVSYWYNATGDVCTKDPKNDESFKPSADTAFYLDKTNGLYVVNTRWNNDQELQDKYFANLSNYAKDEEGNLIVADGGVIYNYDASVWENEGTDGIAFYHKKGDAENVYYADKACTVRVYDLMDVVKSGKLTPRTLTSGEQGTVALEYKNIETNGEWRTYTFYLHTGSEEKNYRLEVWSGTRDNSGEFSADSYVLFAADNRTELTADTWKSTLGETIENAKAQTLLSDDEFFQSAAVRYYAFSFLDSAKFLRYDSTLDKDEIGNSYTSYDSTADDYKFDADKKADYVTYLAYESGDHEQKMIFADFSKTDVSVTADSKDDNTDQDDNTDETDNGGLNVWLLASSIILAVVLLLAIVSISVQRILKKRNRAKAPKATKSARK